MDLEAVLYISPYEGKKIRPEMEVNIALSTVKQEEFGVLLGRVKSVAEFPSTYQGMMRVLSNDQLVKTLSAGGAPIEVHADLIPDSTTINGYRWSSGDGPPNKIYSGTLCSAKVTIREQAPISLVIPYLRESLGL
jgi:HlyD family secretion protein